MPGYAEQIPIPAKAFCNRSVQDTVRVTMEDLDAFLYHNFPNVLDAPIYSTSVRLNQRPVTVKGQRDCAWPDKAMGDFLAQLAATLH